MSNILRTIREKAPAATLAVALGLGASACSSGEKITPSVTTSETAKPSPTPEASVDINDPVALTAANKAAYDKYLGTLSPDLRADIERFSDPKSFSGKSYDELKKIFAIPSSLVTADGTLETLDPKAYAAAATARIMAISTIGIGDIDKLSPDTVLSIEKAVDIVSSYYPGAYDGFLRNENGQKTTPEMTPESAAVATQQANGVTVLQNLTDTKAPSYAYIAVPDLDSVKYTEKTIAWDTTFKDNFPTEDMAKFSGVTTPAYNVTESGVFSDLEIDKKGNITAMHIG